MSNEPANNPTSLEAPKTIRLWPLRVRPGGRLWRATQYAYRRIVRQPGTPEYVARGIAIGFAVTLVLPFGHFIVALLLAFIFRASKPAALVATLPVNPLTGALIYPVEYTIGCALLDISPLGSLPNSWEEFAEFISLHEEDLPALWAYLLGSGLCALVSLPIVYYASRRAVVAYRHWRQQRREAKLAANARSAEGAALPPPKD